jgi:heterodisulfide reductase subunit A
VGKDKCTCFDACTRACVLAGNIPGEWNQNFGPRGASYIPFMQAVSIIDKERCLPFTRSKCVEACQRGALDFGQKDGKVTLDAGTIIVATGLDVYDPTPVTEYGYGRFDNVIHSMEYERLINASGPTSGHLHRRSDDERPRRIAYILCIGSRDVRCGHPYGCSVCCMYATRDAMLAYMHNDDTENIIFYTDLRAFGRGFDEYIKRGADEYGITYVRARPGEVTEDPETKNLYVSYDDTESGGVKSMEVDMVVLSTAFVPPRGIGALGEALGVRMDDHDFFKASDDRLAPMDTNVPGIYIAGACKRPMDVTDAVTQGGGAADRAAQAIKEFVGKTSAKAGSGR